MSELTNISRPDGKSCPVYLARPAGEIRGGLVVVQEWWGMNPQIKGIADRFAAEGFLALVPDLYRGKLASDADEASHYMGNLDSVDATKQDIRGALQHLKQSGATRVGVTGFCMGGALTLRCALQLEEMDAGVCFYGIPRPDAGDPSAIAIPVQLHFAKIDDWCTPAAVDALEAKLKAGEVDHELHRYDAQHGFMNEKRPEVYDEACAKLAWQRAVAFFRAKL